MSPATPASSAQRGIAACATLPLAASDPDAGLGDGVDSVEQAATTNSTAARGVASRSIEERIALTVPRLGRLRVRPHPTHHDHDQALVRSRCSMNLRLTSFQKLALASVIATWVMVVIGVIVRSTGSGMGCPDWPLCYGQVIPPGRRHGGMARVDPSLVGRDHRVPGAGPGRLAWRTQRATRSIVVGSVVALGIVGFQAYLGKVTVDMNNSAETVLAHLATAMILLGTFLFVLIRSRFPAELPTRGASLRIPLLVGFAAISVFTVLLFGAETTCPGVDRGAAGCAALIFPDWPLFDGQLIPTFSDDPAVANLQMRQFSHRIVAAIAGDHPADHHAGAVARGASPRDRRRGARRRHDAGPRRYRRRAVRGAGRGGCAPDLDHAGAVGGVPAPLARLAHLGAHAAGAALYGWYSARVAVAEVAAGPGTPEITPETVPGATASSGTGTAPVSHAVPGVRRPAPTWP